MAQKAPPLGEVTASAGYAISSDKLLKIVFLSEAIASKWHFCGSDCSLPVDVLFDASADRDS